MTAARPASRIQPMRANRDGRWCAAAMIFRGVNSGTTLRIGAGVEDAFMSNSKLAAASKALRVRFLRKKKPLDDIS